MTSVVYGKFIVYVVVCSGIMLVQVPVDKLVVLLGVGVVAMGVTTEGNDSYKMEEAHSSGATVGEP